MSKPSKPERRAALAAYRERKQDWAVCAVRIGAAVWVTLTSDARALENRIGFSLRQGAAPVAAMVAAYKAAGTVEVEVLARLKDDLSPMARARIGEELRDAHASALGATVF